MGLVGFGSIASVLRCPPHVRLDSNLGHDLALNKRGADEPRIGMRTRSIENSEKNTPITGKREIPKRSFSSQDLQQQSGEIQRAAVSAPVIVLSHGKPRSVVMSVEEFRRLK